LIVFKHLIPYIRQMEFNTTEEIIQDIAGWQDGYFA
jgi:hypothetical protein